MHFCDPVSQTIQDEIADKRVGTIQSVTGTGKVGIRMRRILRQKIEACIIDPSERIGGTQMIRLCGVIVDHVENDFDSRRVECSYHFLELGVASSGFDA